MKRYFIISTVGNNPNGTMAINCFDLVTESGNYPTLKACKEWAIKLHPEQTNVGLIGISELSEEDWKHFISEQ